MVDVSADADDISIPVLASASAIAMLRFLKRFIPVLPVGG
jgi:hypothetical protein